jgi:hypothetical protein
MTGRRSPLTPLTVALTARPDAASHAATRPTQRVALAWRPESTNYVAVQQISRTIRVELLSSTYEAVTQRVRRSGTGWSRLGPCA